MRNLEAKSWVICDFERTSRPWQARRRTGEPTASVAIPCRQAGKLAALHGKPRPLSQRYANTAV